MSDVKAFQRLKESRYSLFFLLLCCLLPVTNFISQNSLDVNMDYSSAAIYLGFVFFVGLSTWYGLKTLLKRCKSKALAISIGASILWLFHGFILNNLLESLLKHHYQFRYFLVFNFFGLVALSVSVYFFFKKSRPSIEGFLVASLCFYVLFDLTQIISNAKSDPIHYYKPLNQQAMTSQRPNVYFIVPDMMLGPEMYKALLGKELSFISHLKQKDFLINEKAFSNAPVTVFSLSHVLNMDYPYEENESVTKKKYLALNQLFKYDNPVYQTFHEMGYPIHYVSDGYVSFCSGYEDNCIKKESTISPKLSDFVNRHIVSPQAMAFFDRTKAVSFINNLKFSTKTLDLDHLHYPHALEVDEIIPMLPIEADSGYFMFLHIGLPHFPFRFKADCSRYNGDALYFAGDKLNVYDAQLQCTEKKMAELVDHLIEKDPHAIIIVQSDHGTTTRGQDQKDNALLSEDELLENFNIVSAYRLPQSCQTLLPTDKSLSPVNTFRLVFSCLKNEEPEYLPHKSFLAYYFNRENGSEPLAQFNPLELIGNASRHS